MLQVSAKLPYLAAARVSAVERKRSRREHFVFSLRRFTARSAIPAYSINQLNGKYYIIQIKVCQEQIGSFRTMDDKRKTMLLCLKTAGASPRPTTPSPAVTPHPVSSSLCFAQPTAQPPSPEGKARQRYKASMNRKGNPKGKTCAEFCVGKIQTRCPLGVLSFASFYLHKQRKAETTAP